MVFIVSLSHFQITWQPITADLERLVARQQLRTDKIKALITERKWLEDDNNIHRMAAIQLQEQLAESKALEEALSNQLHKLVQDTNNKEELEEI